MKSLSVLTAYLLLDGYTIAIFRLQNAQTGSLWFLVQSLNLKCHQHELPKIFSNVSVVVHGIFNILFLALIIY